MHCVKCGVDMGDGQFCPACGASRDGVVAGAQQAALKKGVGSFFDALKFRDADAPEEVADSILWINWLRTLAVILFWVGVVGVCLGAISVLISGFAGGAGLMGYGDAGAGIGLIFGSLIGAVILLALGIFFVFTATASILFVLNWARDTAFIRAKTK
ncbi:MAG: DUF1129 domain-containing protein [Coriobacteriia bacterium]|nr:DUF1129 domain-containing protein [Coriobacteriia bacterium]